jgi:hypothetical protein
MVRRFGWRGMRALEARAQRKMVYAVSGLTRKRMRDVPWMRVGANRMLFAVTAALFVTACAGFQTVAPGSVTPNVTANSTSAQDLLYVTLSQSTIGIFSYPTGRRVGEISGQNEPGTPCIDKSGDVFVPNYVSENILEYQHGATTPIATYKDTGHYPNSCSIDPVSSDLAVTDFTNVSHGPGDVAIFHAGTFRPSKRLTDALMTDMRGCAYDSSGNLYIYGLGVSDMEYGLLRAGARRIIKFQLTPDIEDPGQIQWDGAHLVVSDRIAQRLVEYAIVSRTGTKVRTTPLKEVVEADAFWILGNTVVAARLNKTDVGIWAYPAGGRPKSKIATTYYPGSVIISP